MLGITHAVVTGVAVYSCTQDPIMTVMASAASSLPDQIEKYVPFCGHRGLTHWIVWWIALTVLLFLFPHYLHYSFFAKGSITWKLFAGMSLGGLSHVLEDSLSQRGVPIVPGFTLNLGFYKTGGISEYFIAGVLSVLFITFLLWHKQSFG